MLENEHLNSWCLYAIENRHEKTLIAKRESLLEICEYLNSAQHIDEILEHGFMVAYD